MPLFSHYEIIIFPIMINNINVFIRYLCNSRYDLERPLNGLHLGRIHP